MPLILHFGESVTTHSEKIAFPKGPLWHMILRAKRSVLYLLSRLPGKMKVSLEGNTRFARRKSETVSGMAASILDITGIICLFLDQYAVHKYQIDLYHTEAYYHNSLSI